MIRTNSRLAIDIADHCQLSCSHCSHYAPHLPHAFYELDQFTKDIARLSEVMHFGAALLIGGEPLLNENLECYIDILKSYNIADEIELSTNGLLLGRFKPEVYEKLTRVTVFEYSSLSDAQKKAVRSHIKDLRLKMRAPGKVVHYKMKKVRYWEMSCINPDRSLVADIHRKCTIRREFNVVYAGYFCKCTNVFKKSMYLESKGIATDIDWNRDAIAIHGTPELKAKIEAYLDAPDPLAACSWCLGSSGKLRKHSQGTLEADIADSPACIRDLLEGTSFPASLAALLQRISISGFFRYLKHRIVNP